MFECILSVSKWFLYNRDIGLVGSNCTEGKMKTNYGEVIQKVEAFDVRFPTSLTGDGSDAVHSDPDYSVRLLICN